LIALDAINRAGDFMAAKNLIARRIAVDKAIFADAAVPLKNLMPAAAA
jgi:hypothetical protein